MSLIKDRSPFYPGQPVPLEFFVGRLSQIERIERALKQVSLGKPQAVFLTGEYGIGKSSLAQAIRHIGESKYKLLGIHVLLGGAKTINDLSERTLQRLIEEDSYSPKVSEKIRNWLAKYIGQQSVMGIQVDLSTIKVDAPTLSAGFLPFLREAYTRLSTSGTKGIVLIFDELNGIVKNPDFAHFIKTLIDGNALSKNPVPFLLLLCGTEDRRLEMIANHQPIDRIFDLVPVEQMEEKDIRLFYKQAFHSVGVEIKSGSLKMLCEYSDGHPKAMQVLGDNCFWINKDEQISFDDCVRGIVQSAKDIGQKFIDNQVLATIESKDYKSILSKLVDDLDSLSFDKSELEKKLSASEKSKLTNFLQKLKRLRVISSSSEKGVYIFNSRLVVLFLRMRFTKTDVE